MMTIGGGIISIIIAHPILTSSAMKKLESKHFLNFMLIVPSDYSPSFFYDYWLRLRKFSAGKDVSSPNPYILLHFNVDNILMSPSFDLLNLCSMFHYSNIQDYCKNKNVVIVGLPGAFTPT